MFEQSKIKNMLSVLLLYSVVPDKFLANLGTFKYAASRSSISVNLLAMMDGNPRKQALHIQMAKNE